MRTLRLAALITLTSAVAWATIAVRGDTPAAVGNSKACDQ